MMCNVYYSEGTIVVFKYNLYNYTEGIKVLDYCYNSLK